MGVWIGKVKKSSSQLLDILFNGIPIDHLVTCLDFTKLNNQKQILTTIRHTITPWFLHYHDLMN